MFLQLDWLFVPFLRDKLWSITTFNAISVNVLDKWMGERCVLFALSWSIFFLCEQRQDITLRRKQQCSAICPYFAQCHTTLSALLYSYFIFLLFYSFKLHHSPMKPRNLLESNNESACLKEFAGCMLGSENV